MNIQRELRSAVGPLESEIEVNAGANSVFVGNDYRKFVGKDALLSWEIRQ